MHDTSNDKIRVYVWKIDLLKKNDDDTILNGLHARLRCLYQSRIE